MDAVYTGVALGYAVRYKGQILRRKLISKYINKIKNTKIKVFTFFANSCYVLKKEYEIFKFLI